jgi:hypothetical protein
VHRRRQVVHALRLLLRVHHHCHHHGVHHHVPGNLSPCIGYVHFCRFDLI